MGDISLGSTISNVVYFILQFAPLATGLNPRLSGSMTRIGSDYLNGNSYEIYKITGSCTLNGGGRMINTDKFEINSINYIRHKSDSGVLIQRDGTDLKFADVVDVEEWGIHLYRNRYSYSRTC